MITEIPNNRDLKKLVEIKVTPAELHDMGFPAGARHGLALLNEESEPRVTQKTPAEISQGGEKKD